MRRRHAVVLGRAAVPQRGRSLTARALSRYFLDEGTTTYRHVSDQHSTYGTNVIPMAFSLVFMHTVRSGRLLRIPVPPAGQRRAIVKFSIGTLVYAATVGLAFVSAPVTLGVQFLIAAYYSLEQVRPGGPGPTDGQAKPA